MYQHRGLEFHISAVSCDMRYDLTLVPYGKVVRRPRANWSVALIHAEVTDILAHICVKEFVEADVVSGHMIVL